MKFEECEHCNNRVEYVENVPETECICCGYIVCSDCLDDNDLCPECVEEHEKDKMKGLTW